MPHRKIQWEPCAARDDQLPRAPTRVTNQERTTDPRASKPPGNLEQKLEAELDLPLVVGHGLGDRRTSGDVHKPSAAASST